MKSIERIDGRLIVGVLLVAAGVLYLLGNLLNLSFGSLVWAGAAALGGLVLLGGLLRDRSAWWLAIPGLTLLGLATIIAIDALTPSFGDQWSGSIFLGAIGLSFWVVYILDRQMWWAIIPGGVLTTLAVVAGLEDQVGLDTGAVFFLGLGLTFLLVAVIPSERHAMRWAFFPAAILGIMGLMLFVGFENALGYVWPIALIGVGGFLLLRAARRG
jgi:hypothetical protein